MAARWPAPAPIRCSSASGRASGCSPTRPPTATTWPCASPPPGDIGRVWSLSRSLTYRALDQLAQRDLIAPIAEEKGKAGGVRTILAPTKEGRAAVKRWVREPVSHIRDVRGELLLKLVLSEDPRPLLEAQRARFAPMVEALATTGRHPQDRRRPGGGVALRVVARRAAVHRPHDRASRPAREGAGGMPAGGAVATRHRLRPDRRRRRRQTAQRPSRLAGAPNVRNVDSFDCPPSVPPVPRAVSRHSADVRAAAEREAVRGQDAGRPARRSSSGTGVTPPTRSPTSASAPATAGSTLAKQPVAQHRRQRRRRAARRRRGG